MTFNSNNLPLIPGDDGDKPDLSLREKIAMLLGSPWLFSIEEIKELTVDQINTLIACANEEEP